MHLPISPHYFMTLSVFSPGQPGEDDGGSQRNAPTEPEEAEVFQIRVIADYFNGEIDVGDIVSLVGNTQLPKDGMSADIDCQGYRENQANCF